MKFPPENWQTAGLMGWRFLFMSQLGVAQPADDTGDGAPREDSPSVSFERNIADGIKVAVKLPSSFLAREEMNHVDATQSQMRSSLSTTFIQCSLLRGLRHP
jgi:hypothetical protein